MSDYVIETRGLTKTYGEQNSVSNLSIHVKKGRIYGLLGRNGAGKTTTMRMLLGLTAPSSGDVKIFGKPLRGNEKGILPRIGSLIEAPGFYPNLTGTENLQIFADLRGLKSPQYIKGALEVVNLPYRDKKLFSQYSLGMKQRLAIALAVMHNPELLILDEPTNHLDMRSKDVLKDALKEFDGTVIVVSHDREFLDGLVDKVYEFGNKRVIEHLGGIYDFLEHKKMDSLCELERSTQTTTSMEGNAAEPTRNKLSYEARKEQSKAIKKVEKAIAESEKKITELENSIAAIEAKLATPEGAADVSLYTEYSELKKKLSDTMDLWTEQTLELEELNAANS